MAEKSALERLREAVAGLGLDVEETCGGLVDISLPEIKLPCIDLPEVE